MFAGVAPRAKMNQQRARRFKSAREAEEAAAAAARKGEEPQDPDARFDSNCITPGTRKFSLCFLYAAKSTWKNGSFY